MPEEIIEGECAIQSASKDQDWKAIYAEYLDDRNREILQEKDFIKPEKYSMLEDNEELYEVPYNMIHVAMHNRLYKKYREALGETMVKDTAELLLQEYMFLLLKAAFSGAGTITN